MGTYFLTALGLFVVLVLLGRLFCDPANKKYCKTIGRPDRAVKLKEGDRAGMELVKIIMEAAKEKHPKIFLHEDEWKEFSFYFKDARKGNALGLLVSMAHELGCEIVLRRISEEDIEAEHNQGDTFWEYFCDEKERYFKDWQHEFKNDNKNK